MEEILISTKMLRIILFFGLALSTTGEQVNDKWLDPYDMLNYDPNSKTMRKPAETTTYSSGATKRREYIEEPNQKDLASCQEQMDLLQKQIEELKKEVSTKSQQSSCYPVFKRFLSRFLKEIQRVRKPSDSTDDFYDAKIVLSNEAIAEIQAFLSGEDKCRPGALDNAISQILVDLKLYDVEKWRWRFEDTFVVELEVVLKIAILVLIISTTISTQLWSVVSWFVQFRRMFAICFFISIIWNWFYLYQIAFADHQNNLVKMDSVYQKCTGERKIDWSDSLKEWFRSTWTLQDDPCKKYYEVLMVNPILLVPPTKAIAVTITTFITDPLKHVGQGISEFLRALLKDLPVTLQIPVLLTIVLAILVMMYGSVQAVFQHGIMAPLRRPRDPPPPGLQQPQQRPLMVEGHDNLAGGDAPAAVHAPPVAPQQNIPRHQVNNAQLQRNDMYQRRDGRVRKEPPPTMVETLRAREPFDIEDEIDHHTESAESAESPPESESENEQRNREDSDGPSAANSTQPKPRPTGSKVPTSKEKPLIGKKNNSQKEHREEAAAAKSDPVERLTPQKDVPNPDELAGERSPLRHVETIGISVQETRPAEEE